MSEDKGKGQPTPPPSENKIGGDHKSSDYFNKGNTLPPYQTAPPPPPPPPPKKD